VPCTFQSAPDAEAGRNARPQAATETIGLFQSAPDAEAGRNSWTWPQVSSQCCFNPLPTQRPGETAGSIHSRLSRGVSIRSRRRGREKLAELAQEDDDGEFQSAPDAQAGRNPKEIRCPPRPCRFNPLPTHRPGETTVSFRSKLRKAVSIRSRRRGREKPGAHVTGDAVALVSIRSRRRGREKPSTATIRRPTRSFQSAPDAEAGRNARFNAASAWSARFNPLPTQRPGETAGPGPAGRPWPVSIRSRRRGREKPTPGARTIARNLFQSAPDAEAGRNTCRAVPTPPGDSFNPLPTQRPGETGTTHKTR